MLIFFVLSCKGISKKNNHNDTGEKPFSTKDIPNANTQYDTIYTVKLAGNVQLIDALITKLKQADFTFEEQDSRGEPSYINYTENRITIVEGNGIRKYFAISKKPEKDSKNLYPDFWIWVYKFQTDDIAQQHYEQLNKVQSSERYCNGKSPEKLVLNGNEVFHLSTRAEAFRTYIEKYDEFIKSFR